MNIGIEITTEPLRASATLPAGGACGAVVEFAGIVRAQENGRRIEALHYEAYQPMARAEMERILRALEEEFPCRSVSVTHRIGRVPVGEAAIVVRIEAAHRAEAFGLLAAFMDHLKKDVPIWKLGP